MIASTVIDGFSDAYGSWNTICILPRSCRRACASSEATSVPRYRTEPPVDGMRCKSIRPVVDFPQPDSPTNPNVSAALPFIAPSNPEGEEHRAEREHDRRDDRDAIEVALDDRGPRHRPTHSPAAKTSRNSKIAVSTRSNPFGWKPRRPQTYQARNRMTRENSSGSSEAPPTRAPSISGIAMRSAMLPGFTLPP